MAQNNNSKHKPFFKRTRSVIQQEQKEAKNIQQDECDTTDSHVS